MIVAIEGTIDEPSNTLSQYKLFQKSSQTHPMKFILYGFVDGLCFSIELIY